MTKSHKCKKCGQSFEYTQDQIYFDEHGLGYSTKLVKCSECGCPNVLHYYMDTIDINRDKRYF